MMRSPTRMTMDSTTCAAFAIVAASERVIVRRSVFFIKLQPLEPAVPHFLFDSVTSASVIKFHRQLSLHGFAGQLVENGEAESRGGLERRAVSDGSVSPL